jgi:uncharacterized protein YecE (DUF72 family)
MTQRLFAGASGYSFKEWYGTFYPDKLKPDAMLAWYAARLPTVEINNTFYRMPAKAVLEKWVATTPTEFRFAIKASRRITHMARLQEDARDSVDYLYRQLAALQGQRGPVLFQLPPHLKLDLPRLQSFLQMLPPEHGAAFEFRHDSWFDDTVYAALREAGAALVVSEREDGSPPPLVQTTDWGYVRLRLEEYSDDALHEWALRLAATCWREIYAFFMHEPTAPDYALRLMQQFANAHDDGAPDADDDPLLQRDRRRTAPTVSDAEVAPVEQTTS